MQYVQDLEVGLIPRSEFAKRQWFSASPRWYYHRPGRPVAKRMSGSFYQLLDEHLREPCLMLHQAGLSTLPSCEGHFHEPRYFAEVWEQLQREQDAIRSTGLFVSDSETGEAIIFRNSDYVLPWRSFTDFLADLSESQPGGYLGIGLGPEQRHIARELNRYPYRETGASICIARPRVGFWIAAVCADPDSPEDVRKIWSDVSRYLRRLTHMMPRRPAVDIPGSSIHRPN